MFYQIKYQFANILRHYKLFAFIGILLFICYKMFMANYSLTSPIVSKRDESYTEVWNGRATCLTDLDQAVADKDKAILANLP